ncbi:hypothetical protein M7I_7636 [Glarea lozoyensis 74030]|uniref:Uncharacterized protein n=1 Tax=Glarea lozoyensis (strain ATCC 74030 / MF5533) TaxID=1104152 RepID=H0EXU6_GLAL7|nr:hypothetical protein M7I_7636 [Glarea lozoyensis 74030]
MCSGRGVGEIAATCGAQQPLSIQVVEPANKIVNMVIFLIPDLDVVPSSRRATPANPSRPVKLFVKLKSPPELILQPRPEHEARTFSSS